MSGYQDMTSCLKTILRILCEEKTDMGTFATLFHKAGAGIPDEKRKNSKSASENCFKWVE